MANGVFVSNYLPITTLWFIYTYRYRLPEFGLLSTIPPHCVFARLKRNIPMSPTDLGAKISSLYHARKLTLFGRSLLLLSCELMMNVVCWIVAGILFGRSENTRPVLSLALLAWTIGLRHALDADHISAIDNATRSLISLGQLPVTCGLFFSLGHSTIVIAVNVAIAISTSVYDRIDGVGKVGGIVGDAVSGSFLFIVGLANSIILWRILVKRRRMEKERRLRLQRGEDPTVIDSDLQDQENHGSTLMMKLIGPIVTFVDRPWKMYPVGVLFGFGFDTASSIALLAVSAIAKKDSSGQQIPPSDIVILPLLFTAGMTLIDSVDSIIMLYSYTGFPDRSFALFDRKAPIQSRISVENVPNSPDLPFLPSVQLSKTASPVTGIQELRRDTSQGNLSPKASKVSILDGEHGATVTAADVMDDQVTRQLRVKRNAMSGLSVILTLMSILVAFSISLITIMGLIGDNCSSCQEAANAPDGGGLAGRWWRGWADANNQSGYIGAAIVGGFVAVVGSWYGVRYVWHRRRPEHVSK